MIRASFALVTCNVHTEAGVSQEVARSDKPFAGHAACLPKPRSYCAHIALDHHSAAKSDPSVFIQSLVIPLTFLPCMCSVAFLM